MAVELANHIHEMTNAEKNSVAKLRFTDKATQIALAKDRYLLCRKYLALNPNLCPKARDILLAGKANSVKVNLMVAGHLNDAPDKIADVYYAARRRGIVWWSMSWFTRGSYWSGSGAVPNTPTKVLQDIYDTTLSTIANGRAGYGAERTLLECVSHPNAPLEMALRASTSEMEKVKRAGFDRLVEIEKAKQAAA